jgi:cyclophilin family peptidyl-prolyl cis-trans isomerase
MNIKLWGLLALLIAGLCGMSWWLSKIQDENKPVRVDTSTPQLEQLTKPKTAPEPKNATKEPGRVVVLTTNRGVIEFTLYEKDCPRTTARVAELVQGGFYNGVNFPRVEDWVIQTQPATKQVPAMGLEIVNGLTHAKGTVGMARTTDPNSNTSVFYITLEPAYQLDLEYTIFGRVIKGMGVAMKIKLGDTIKTATLRPLTQADKKLFDEALKIESDRRTQ